MKQNVYIEIKHLEIIEILLQNFKNIQYGGNRTNQAVSYDIGKTSTTPSNISYTER